MFSILTTDVENSAYCLLLVIWHIFRFFLFVVENYYKYNLLLNHLHNIVLIISLLLHRAASGCWNITLALQKGLNDDAGLLSRNFYYHHYYLVLFICVNFNVM